MGDVGDVGDVGDESVAMSGWRLAVNINTALHEEHARLFARRGPRR